MFDLAPARPASSTAPLMELTGMPGLYADALLTDERGSLLFISLWGRDTALQELLARMTLASSENGLRSLQVVTAEGPATVHFDRMPCMEKHSGRMPPRNLFGHLVQTWIFDRLAVEPDRANRRALLFHRAEPSSSPIDDRLWQLVREVSHLPLLDHWQQPVLSLLQDRQWLQTLRGHAISAWHLDLGSPQFELAVSELVRCGALQLDDSTGATAMTPRLAA